jgi:hypothetical protein
MWHQLVHELGEAVVVRGLQQVRHFVHYVFHVEEQSRLLKRALDILNPEERQAIESRFSRN